MASRSDIDATIRNALQRCDATCRTARAKKDDTLAAIDAPLGSQRWIAELNAAWDDFRTTIREAGIQYSAIRADALIETETAPATPTTHTGPVPEYDAGGSKHDAHERADAERAWERAYEPPAGAWW